MTDNLGGSVFEALEFWPYPPPDPERTYLYVKSVVPQAVVGWDSLTCGGFDVFALLHIAHQRSKEWVKLDAEAIKGMWVHDARWAMYHRKMYREMERLIELPEDALRAEVTIFQLGRLA